MPWWKRIKKHVVKKPLIHSFKTTLVKGYLQIVAPGIYAVVIENDYDRAMLFCRYQEFYESPYKEFRGKEFSLEYFVKHYMIKTKKNVFRYHLDWGGYNIPSDSLQKSYKVFERQIDEYNLLMREIIEKCEEHSLNEKYYLIGVDDINTLMTRHEIAHGLYYINSEYRKDINTLLKKIDKKTYQFAKNYLTEIGYSQNKKIIDDEIQAYLSTGLPDKLKNSTLRKYIENFNKKFREFYLYD
jgi:hypothetical protein